MKTIQLFACLVCLSIITPVTQADTWLQRQMLTASDGAAGDLFGTSVAVSGDYAIVGASCDDNRGTDAGCVYILKWNGTLWAEQQMLTASDGAASDNFGWSVSISGDYAIVGAPVDDNNGSDSGSVYIFKRNGTLWNQQQMLTAPDGAAGDTFGMSVSINGDYAIVGAPADDNKGTDSGSVYLFKRDSALWTCQQMLTASDGAANDNFGWSVSISGDYAIASAPGDDNKGSNSGSIYTLKRKGTLWSEQQMLTAPDGAAGNLFGYSVSMSGDSAIVGAPGDDNIGTDSGSVYLFIQDGVLWTWQQMLTTYDSAAGDSFGWSVSINGDYAIAGSPGDDNYGNNSGSVYLFKRDRTLWSLQRMLTATDTLLGDCFGWSVSISTDTNSYAAIGGALYDDNNGTNSGSVYLLGFSPIADLTGDCKVNLSDFSVFAEWWLYGTY